MIKFLHLLSVIVFCTVKFIECSDSIYNELLKYYDSDIQQQFKEEWWKYQRGFENEIASNVRENFGTTALNIYEPGKRNTHLLARGFQLTDGVVMVYFYEMVLRQLPHLLRPKLEMQLPSNFLKFESRLGRMFIDSTYYVARNSSSIVYARPEDQRFLSPFSLQQVDTIGRVAIVAEDCLLTGFAISTLSGDSVSLGHSSFSLLDCKLMVEISTPNSGAPPVIAPYFPPGPKELLEMIIARPVREELQNKLQGAMYSYINTSVLFERAADYRNNQLKLFKSYAGFMTKYVADLNRKTITQNKAHVNLPNYEVTMDTETDKSRMQCHVTLTDIVLYGLDTAYVTRAGGPYNDGSPKTVADTIIFSSMQIRGKITHNDANGTSTNDFAVELTDVTVILVIVIEKEKNNLQQIHFTGWRSLEFSIIPRQTSNKDRHEHQSLVYGHILNELPVRILNHVTSMLGHAHGAIDGNKDNDDASGDNGGSNGGGGDNGGSDDNGGGSGGGADETRSVENDDSPPTKPDNKAKGFFSDDFLDDKFFSDDNLDKNFFSDGLDKNFLKDNLDKNFFNDSKETDGNDEKVTGSDYKDNDMNGNDGGDEGGVSNNKEGDEKNTATGSNETAQDKTNGYKADEGKYPIDENKSASDHEETANVENDNGGDDDGDENKPVNDDEEPENTKPEHDDGHENEPAGDDEEPDNTNGEHDNEDENKPADDDKEPVINEKNIDKNMETDFFSDDFLQTDFFTDDEFGVEIGSKEQGDATGNKKEDMEGNDGNNKDQIDNADNDNDVPDVNSSYGEKVNEDDRNVEGNNDDVVHEDNEKDTHSPINNADYGDEVPDINDDGEGQVEDEKNIFGDEENVAHDDTKKPVLDKDFFSGENVKGSLDKDFFSGEKKTLNNKKKEYNNEGIKDGNGENDANNVDKGKKKLWVFASGEGKKDAKLLSGESFLSDVEFDLDSGDGSRRHLAQDKNTTNERDPKNRDSDIDEKRKHLTIPIEEKRTSKENVTENLEDSREGKKVVSNVHNTRRRQSVHTSDNEIR